MVVNKQVNFIECLSTLLIKVSNSIKDKFSKFYTKRIFDLDLAPSKTFSYPFIFGGEGDMSHRRSLSKLKSLFSKYLTKVNPALQLALNEFIPQDSSTGNVTINLFNLYYGEVMPAYDAKIYNASLGSEGERGAYIPTKSAIMESTYLEGLYLKSVNETKSLYRYARYLNYLARKNDVPIEVSIQRNLYNSGSSLDSDTRAEIYLRVSFVRWACRRTTERNRYMEIKKTGVNDDSLFSNPGLWDTHDLPNGGAVTEVYGYHPAKFFVHLDKAVKVLSTLSRKVEYEYSAFTFRT